MVQHNYYEQKIKERGYEPDHQEKIRKKKIKQSIKSRLDHQTLTGRKAILDKKKRYKEKLELKQKVKVKKLSKYKDEEVTYGDNPVPVFLLDSETNPSKQISSSVKEKRKQMAKSSSLKIPKLPVLNEFEVLKELRTGKRGKKSWKRVVRKCTFVGEDFTRKPPKLEKYVRPTALRMKKAHVSHPVLKTTFSLDILGVKENPHSKIFSGLGVLTKGTIIEVNVSEIGKVSSAGKIIWGKYAQITNNPELDACVNAVLLV